MAAEFFPGYRWTGPDPECVRGVGEQALAARSDGTVIGLIGPWPDSSGFAPGKLTMRFGVGGNHSRRGECLVWWGLPGVRRCAEGGSCVAEETFQS
jgi:hypothetical protein